LCSWPLAALFAVTPALAAASDPPTEDLAYRWRLVGLRGAVAGLFFPNSGEGRLSTRLQDDGHLLTELMITSQASRGGEFWRYAAEIDPFAGRTVRAWSSFMFRGERKAKEQVVEEDDVFDLTGGIYLVRRELPSKPLPMRIWADGKVYAVVVEPKGMVQRSVGRGTVLARHFVVSARLPGARVWDGRLEMWLALDPAATPIEILVERGWAGVRLVKE
jgi:hypothetical protein